MVIVCTSKQFKLLNFTKQQGGVFKLIKTETHMSSQTKIWLKNIYKLIYAKKTNFSLVNQH
jgi:hypothetical protein